MWNFTDPAATEFIYLAPIYVNGDVFIIDKYNIACLNATNGHTIWSFFTGDELYIAPSYADGKIYDVTSERHIFVLDATNNGAKLATVTTPSSSWSSPTIANGRLYIGCNDWNVYCYSGYIGSTASPSTPSHNVLSSSYLTAVLAAVVVIVIIIVVAVAYVVSKRSKKVA
jgi:outer membrane protein assembly factor BamB